VGIRDIGRTLSCARDGFRNDFGNGHQIPAEHLLVERARMLTLTAPEMTVLVGGLRALDARGRARRGGD
jgi:catalase-peroxidase